MWSKLQTRHYSILVLTAIVALETSAIGVDRLFAKPNDTAFEVVGTFRNNGLINQYRSADGKASPAPAHLSAFQKSIPVAAAGTRMAISSPPNIMIPGGRVADRANSAPSITISSHPDNKPALNFSSWVDYTVSRGDSLSGIAGIFGTTSDAICQANGLKDQRNLKSGQKIKVPMVTTKIIYNVKEGDTLNRIANRFNIGLQELIKANNLPNHLLITDQKLHIPVRFQSSKLQLVKAGSSQEPSLPNLQMETGPSLTMARVQAIQMIAPAKPSMSIAKFDTGSPAVRNLQSAKTIAAAAAPQAKLTDSLPLQTTIPVMAKAPAKPCTTANLNVPVPPAATSSRVQTSVSTLAQTVNHTVKGGESLASLARKYGTSISEIVANNQLSSSNLKPGTDIRIPSARKQYKVTQGTSHRTDVGTSMCMPVRGRMSDPFGWRKHPVYRRRLFHAGIDIAAPRGTPIMASMPGTVVYSGWMSGYGRLVVLRHANGISTRYGHCSRLNVRKGQTVRAGQVVAQVGATGTATGNHLHFEVRSNGKAVNPMTYLRR